MERRVLHVTALGLKLETILQMQQYSCMNTLVKQ